MSLVFLSCNPTTEEVLPKQLAGMRRVVSLSGENAQRFINRLHHKNVTPESSFIGEYTNAEGTAALYVSLYTDAKLAYSEGKRMSTLISEGKTPFGHLRQESIQGVTIWKCRGMGQLHFFFSYRDRLYWLGVDSSIAEETFSDLFRQLVGDNQLT
ncbi:MAG: hypothetical protein V1799_12235 [bacterium]